MTRASRTSTLSSFRWLQLLVLAVALLAVWGATLRWTTPRSSATLGGSVSVREALGGVVEAGFERAEVSRPFVFPADHGPHPAFRSEWWYVTGNVETAGGRRFGLQVTLFRQALRATAPERTSSLATNEVWMGHFAVTDIEAGEFHAFERFARGAGGLAGAQADRMEVWIEDWRMSQQDGEPFALQLELAEEDVAIDLRLDAEREVVLRGDEGLSRKGPEPGNASYYYAIPRLATRGTIVVGGARYDVTGLTWLDREWSTSVLSDGIVGWDWFALQLDDERDLMVYQLRRADGSVAPFSAGAVTAPDGTATSFAVETQTIEVLDTWDSPRGGATYPARWRIRVPTLALELEVTPRVADQEWGHSVRYWEGATSVRGTSNGRAVTGDGYVELVGYAQDARRPRGE